MCTRLEGCVAWTGSTHPWNATEHNAVKNRYSLLWSIVWISSVGVGLNRDVAKRAAFVSRWDGHFLRNIDEIPFGFNVVCTGGSVSM